MVRSTCARSMWSRSASRKYYERTRQKASDFPISEIVVLRTTTARWRDLAAPRCSHLSLSLQNSRHATSPKRWNDAGETHIVSIASSVYACLRDMSKWGCVQISMHHTLSRQGAFPERPERPGVAAVMRRARHGIGLQRWHAIIGVRLHAYRGTLAEAIL